MESIIIEIKSITKTFEFGNEAGALSIIKALDLDAIFIKDVTFDDPQQNKELVKALDELSEFKKKFEDKFPLFVKRISILRINAAKL